MENDWGKIMNRVGQPERLTQDRVVQLFRDELKNTYLGNWEGRPNNSNIEEKLLTNYLTKKGCSPAHSSLVLNIVTSNTLGF